MALVLNMYDANTKTFGTIDDLLPEFVGTGEAPLFRRWCLGQGRTTFARPWGEMP